LHKLLRFVTIFGLLLASGLFAAACALVGVGGGGGGGALTLEEFFAELEPLDDRFEADSNEIDARFDTLSDEEVLDQAPDLLQEQAALISEFMDGLEDLEAPDEAADLQEQMVSAGRRVVDSFEAALSEVEDAATLDELFAVFDNDEDFSAAIERFDEVCLDAEALAADNDITIDLNCEE